MINTPVMLLVPFGNGALTVSGWLAEKIPLKVSYRVKIANCLAPPPAAYDQARKQYKGESFLQQLKKYSREFNALILGVVDEDCFAEGLYYVFGQAVLNGKEAFIALSRLRQSFYGLPTNQALFLKRVLKEAVHEIGHSRGLTHCSDAECVMHFSYSLHDTDIKSADYCQKCVGNLKK